MTDTSHIVTAPSTLLECELQDGTARNAHHGGNPMEKRRLGRGLDALVGNGNGTETESATQASVAVSLISQNPYQPRKSFDQDELASLCESIRTHGILQPLVVRQVEG